MRVMCGAVQKIVDSVDFCSTPFENMIWSLRMLCMRKAAMIGLQNEPEHLLYAFRLESHVARDHLLRGINCEPNNFYRDQYLS